MPNTSSISNFSFGNDTVKEPVRIILKNIVYSSSQRSYMQEQMMPWKKHPPRILLDHVSFIANPGEVLMILGPSGSGKTTLLNTIGLRIPSRDTIQGDLLYNGQQVTPQVLQGFLNYCMERDVLLNNLSVFETFELSAKLRLPELDHAKRLERIESILTSMSLQHCRSSLIGGASTRGLSTSEIKRVSIGLELLDSPSVLICDEPTSGLDFNMSAKLVQCLVNQAKKGTTVIMTIHQPSSHLLNMCDRLLFLCNGCVAFFGTVEQSINHLLRMGIRLPPEWEVSDIFIFLLSFFSHVHSPSEENGSRSFDFLNSLEKKILQGCHIHDRESLFFFWNQSNKKKKMDQDILHFQSIEPLPSSSQQKLRRRNLCPTLRSRAHQISTLQHRTFLNSIRNNVIWWTILVIHILQAFLFGNIFSNVPQVKDYNYHPALFSNDLWNENPWLKELTFVSSKEPFSVGFTPLLDLYQRGVDGNGSFVFFSTSTSLDEMKQRLHYVLDDVVSCLYKKYGLHDLNYPHHDILNKSFSSQSKRWFPERFHTDLIALYQIFDFVTDEKPWKKKIDLFKFFSPECQNMMCRQQTAHHAFHEILECTGSPPILPPETSQTKSSAKMNSSLYPNDPILQAKIVHREQVNNEAKLRCKKKLDQFQMMRLNASDIERNLWNALGKSMEDLTDVVYLSLCRLVTCEEPFCHEMNRSLLYFNEWKDHLLTSLYSAFNLSGCLFLMITLVGLSGFQGILTFLHERELFNRETANGLYSPYAYFLGKNITDIPFSLIPCLITATIFFFLTDSRVTTSQFFIYCLVIGLTSFAAYGFVYIVATISPRLEVAILIGPLMLGLLFLLAGFFVRDANLPSSLAWLGYFSFFRWAYFSLIINHFPSDKFYGSLPNTVIQSALGVTNPSLSVNILRIFLVGIFYRFLAYICLCYFNRHSGLVS